ncbi:MAG: hypothetical protein LBQ81_07985 [Zoogloeaceae bacterium]|jgi:hypothetical protein|nr:hypothetical protein [Zoogloeaceae bacterium]
MARDIMTDAVQAAPAAVPPQVTAPAYAAIKATYATAPAEVPPLKQDALAEAFPDWNLVPAVPFVRRVK